MGKGAKKIFSWCLILSFVLTQILFTNTALAQSLINKRISGSDRYKTAVAISQQGWETSNYAVIARGDDFADALCAGPLAKKYSAPILLTQPGQMNTVTLDELKRLGVKQVFIIGGIGAVSQNVENALKSAGISKVERIFGSDRYETSVKIAEKLGDISRVVVATGNDYPDALSISAIAAKSGMPILLTGSDILPDCVSRYIQNEKVNKTYIIGGTGAVSDSVKNSVPSAVRLSGNDRYETNTIVMKEFESQLDFTNIYAAVGDGPNGDEFADALAGAVLAARTSSPVILVGSLLPDVTGSYIKGRVSVGTRVTALGGEGAVSQGVIDKLESYVNLVAVEARYDKAGTYGPDKGTSEISGNVVIGVRDVKLQNTVIKGDLLLAEGIGDGNVYLNNVTVEGTTIVRGGGPNSVIMFNFNGRTVIVDVPDNSNVRLVAEGDTNIDELYMNSDGRIEERDVDEEGFIDVVIPDGVTVAMIGEFDTVDVGAGRTNVTLEEGTIETLNANAPATITGGGSIRTANIYSEGVVISLIPETTNVADGITANVGGRDVTGTEGPETPYEPPVTGGGGGAAELAVTLSRINDKYIRTGTGLSFALAVNPGDAVITAVSDNDDFDVSVEGNTLTINAGETGMATVTVTAAKEHYSGATKTFKVSSPVHNFTRDKYYDSLNEAIEDADEEDVILAAPGAYDEALITVDKPLKLYGPNFDRNASDNRDDESREAVIHGRMVIASGNVDVSGFTFKYEYSSDARIGYNDNSYVITINSGCANTEISNNIIEKVIPGDITADANWRSRTGQAAVMALGYNNNTTITGNSISYGPIAFNNRAPNIRAKVAAPVKTRTITIEDNVIENTNHEAIWIVEAEKISIMGNTLSNYNLASQNGVTAVKIVNRPGTIINPGTVNGSDDDSRYEGLIKDDNNGITADAKGRYVNLQWIVYVDDDDNTPDHAKYFDSISEAAFSAPRGGSVFVKQGEYNLTEPVVINKPLIFKGPQAGRKGTEDERSSEAVVNARNSQIGFFVTPRAGRVIIDGFTVVNGAAGMLAGGVPELFRAAVANQGDENTVLTVKSNRFVDNFIGAVFNNISMSVEDAEFSMNYFATGTYQGPSIGIDRSNASILSLEDQNMVNWTEILGDMEDSRDNGLARAAAVNPIEVIISRLSIGALIINPAGYQFADNELYGLTAGVVIAGNDDGEGGLKHITDNYIHGNRFGLGLVQGANRTKINLNRISNNMVGLTNIPRNQRTYIDATRNWWGTTDAVEIAATVIDLSDLLLGEASVNYFPWALDEGFNEYASYVVQVDDDWEGLLHGKQVVPQVQDGNKYYIGINAFSSIKEAAKSLVDSEEVPTIFVAPGRYEEVEITKSVIIKSLLGPDEQPVEDGVYISGNRKPGISVRGESRNDYLYVQLEGLTIKDSITGLFVEELNRVNLVLKNNYIRGNVRGGVHVVADSRIEADITGNQITNNGSYKPNDGSPSMGGGIRMVAPFDQEAAIDATITDNTISDNLGGSIRLGWWDDNYHYPGGDITAVIKNNIMENNVGGGVGGYIRVQSANIVDVEVTNNTFRSRLNDGSDLGGIVRIGFGSCERDDSISDKVKAVVTENIFDFGTAADEVEIGGIVRVLGNDITADISKNEIHAGYYVGGVIRVGYGDHGDLVAQNADVTINENTMDIDADDLGGAIRVYAVEEVTAKINGNTISGVGADDDEQMLDGGAVRIGHGCGVDTPAGSINATMEGNTISGFNGGGIRIVADESITARLTGNTVEGCKGGGIRIGYFCDDADDWVTEVTNVTVTDNTVTDNYANGIHVEGHDQVKGNVSDNTVTGTKECGQQDGDGDERYDYSGVGILVKGADISSIDVEDNELSNNGAVEVEDLMIIDTLTAGIIADMIENGDIEVLDPAQDSVRFTMPEVPGDYTISIKSSSSEGVIAKNGTITLPDEEKEVDLVFTITNTKDRTDTADTAAITITVPAKAPEVPPAPALRAAAPVVEEPQVPEEKPAVEEPAAPEVEHPSAPEQPAAPEVEQPEVEEPSAPEQPATP